MTRPSDRVAVEALVRSVPHLYTDDVRAVLGECVSIHNLARMRAQHAILGHRVPRIGYLYPAFQFDVAFGRLDPHVTRINRALGQVMGASEALVWWLDAPDGAITPAQVLESGDVERVRALLPRRTGVEGSVGARR